MSDDLNHEWLVERFLERSAIDPADRAGFAYVSGRIDEFCTQNAVTDDERAAAHRDAERRLDEQTAHLGERA